MAQLKVAIIGQSPFAAEVYKLLRQKGHQITGVFTIPDKGNREDPLGMSSYGNFIVSSIFRESSTKNINTIDYICWHCLLAHISLSLI